jgi:hypothetical protein
VKSEKVAGGENVEQFSPPLETSVGPWRSDCFSFRGALSALVVGEPQISVRIIIANRYHIVTFFRCVLLWIEWPVGLMVLRVGRITG